jgi:hypothetical protein
MTVNLEFDRATANYTVHVYFEAYRLFGKGEDKFGGAPAQGQFTLRFAGILDAYHSDVLDNDTTTPTWLRTVGFNNNSQNIGFTGAAGRMCSLVDAGSWALALVITQVLWLILS